MSRGDIQLPRARRARRGAGLAMALALLCLLAGAAGAAAQEPVFRIDALTDTTVASGGTTSYLLQVTNVGTADAVAPADPTCDPNNPPMDPDCVVVTATLPEGLTATSMSGGGFDTSTCTNIGVPGPVVVTCAGAPPLTIPSEGNPTTFVAPTFSVSVDPSAHGQLTSSFEVSGGGTAAPADTVRPLTVTDTPPGFGVSAFDGQVTADAAGNPYTQAAGHPYAASTSIDLNTVNNPDPLIGQLWPVEPVKDLVADLPPGFVGNPTVADTCTMADLANSQGPDPRSLCAPTSQVGTVMVRVRNLPFLGGQYVRGPIPLYNVVPPANVPARFGFNFAGVVVTLDGGVRSSGDYGLSVSSKNISELAIAGTTITLWGVPADASHDVDRACPNAIQPWLPGGTTCQSGAPLRAFLRNPTSCTPANVGLPTVLHSDSWVHPAQFNVDGTPNLNDPTWQSTSFVTHVPPAYPSPSSDWGHQQGPDGCDKVPFDPALSAEPDTPARAGSPSGFTFDLSLPQSDDPNAIDEADLKKAVVTLPAGVRVSPSGANGLGACTPDQIGLHSTADPACPGSSKVGSLTIKTPLLKDPLSGSIYLATPHDNPFGSLIAIYLVAKGPGVIIKLPGQVSTDPNTGQITTTFDDNPQLPFSDLRLTFDGGPRAALVTPSQCGSYTMNAELTSWSGKQVPVDHTFTIDHASDGGPCAPLGFSPGFTAGTVNPVAGVFTPFILQLQRTDEDQEFQSLRSLSLPPGLSASLRGTTYCPDSALDAADTSKNSGYAGAQELAAPSCPASSRIGTATVGAGAGPDPFYVDTGKMYLAGPYRGAPLSIAVSVPAVAGPFDLGNVITRAALYIDPATAQLRAVSDPFPTILDGIPMQIKDIRLNVDRPHFMLNPTNCSQMSVDGTVLSTENMSADVHSRFQVGECGRLGFKPKLALKLTGKTNRGGDPALRAVLTMPPGGANIARAAVTLPHSEFLDNAHIRTVCTRVQYAAGAGGGSQCPAGSIYGHARAFTPLLDQPLEGPVYLRSSSHQLPDLAVSLNGQIHVDLDGRVDSTRAGGIRTTFEAVPDAFVSKFVLTMAGGKKGLLENSTNICRGTHRASAQLTAHNGKTADSRPTVTAAGCGGKAHRHHKRHG